MCSSCKYIVSINAEFQADVVMQSTKNSTLPNNGALVVAGGVGVAKNLSVGGNITAFSADESQNLQSGAIVVKGGVAVNKNLNVGGKVKLSSLEDSEDCLSGALVVAGGVGIAKSLNVCGSIYSANDITAEQDITAGRDLRVLQNATVDGDIVGHGGLMIDEDAHIGGNFGVDGNFQVDGTIDAVGNIHTDANIDATGNIHADGNIDADGDIHADGNLDADGNVHADGNVDADGNVHADGNVTATLDVTAGRRIYQAGSLLLPVGSLFPYAGAVAPGGYLLCDGAAVSRATYADLFAAIGTTYGAGNGVSTFNLPNLQGRFAIGANGSHLLSSTGGSESNTLTALQMPAHTHTGTTDSAGSHSHSINDPGHAHISRIGYDDGNASNIPGQAPSGDADFGDSQNGMATNISGTGISINASGSHTHTFTTDSTGGGQSFSILNPFLALNYIIKI